VTGFLATVAGGIASTGLTPASGCQDHTALPSASAPFVKGATASTASRSNVRDDRETPLCVGRDAEQYSLICISEKQKYFFKRGWTEHRAANEVICPSGNRLLMRFARDDARGIHCFAQKQPPTFVSSLRSVAARDTAKNPLPRDFACRSIFDFFNSICQQQTWRNASR
jgi:hypothetical protein